MYKTHDKDRSQSDILLLFVRWKRFADYYV